MIRILLATVIITAIAKPAYAYIDVAIGGLILQALIGGFFTFMVVWRNWITKLKNFFKGNGFTNPDENADIETTTPKTSEE